MMRRRVLAFCVFLVILVVVGTSTVRGQDVPEPGQPGYFDAKLALLLAEPSVDHEPDTLFRLLSFMWSDSMVRAGELLLDERLESEPQLQSQLIAETGVWEATYRVAKEMPPLRNPKFAPMQPDTTEAMRLSVEASTAIRDYVMTGSEESLNQAVIILEEMNAIIARWEPFIYR